MHGKRSKQVAYIYFQYWLAFSRDILFYQFVSMNAEVININANYNDHNRR